jgi:hypothetical protein
MQTPVIVAARCAPSHTYRGYASTLKLNDCTQNSESSESDELNGLLACARSAYIDTPVRAVDTFRGISTVRVAWCTSCRHDNWSLHPDRAPQWPRPLLTLFRAAVRGCQLWPSAARFRAAATRLRGNIHYARDAKTRSQRFERAHS